MGVDDGLKKIMQLCADVQDGLWLGSAHARRPELAEALQTSAVEWNAFADRVFQVLLAVDHTSPEAKWKANPQRDWMNPGRNLESMDDAAIVDECVRGLRQARESLQASGTATLPEVRDMIKDQLRATGDQQSGIDRLSADRRPV